MIFVYTLVQHIVSLLLDRHFVLCLPTSFFFMSDDDEDVVRRDGAHLSNFKCQKKKKKKKPKDFEPANELRFSL